MAKNDGGPAFPHLVGTSYGYCVPASGMSTRTWLAGQAMEGILSNDVGIKHVICEAERTDVPLGEVLAKSAAAFADFLLAELEKDQ